MTTPQTYTLRYPFTGDGCDLAVFVVLNDAVDWLAANDRHTHLVSAYADEAFASFGNGAEIVAAEAVIVLNDPDTAMLLKLSLISD